MPMNTPTLPNPLLASYLQLAASLSSASKLDLIAQLSASVKGELAATHHAGTFAQAFGAFESDKTAEEVIDDLRASRTFTRQIESF